MSRWVSAWYIAMATWPYDAMVERERERDRVREAVRVWEGFLWRQPCLYDCMAVWLYGYLPMWLHKYMDVW